MSASPSDHEPPRPPARQLGIRHPRLFWIGFPLLLAILIGLHWEHSMRRARQDAPAHSSGVVVQVESGAGGHTALSIAEPGTAGALTFAQLGTWVVDPAQPAMPCPPAVQDHHGRQVDLVGFMYPLSPDDQVRTFCLLRSTQTCCFGPKPQFNQYVLVETATPVRFERTRPVTVSGRFQVDPQPRQGYIYRLEQATVTPASDDQPVIDGRAFAAANSLGFLAWDQLAVIDPSQPADALPAAVRALDGRPVVVDGFLLDPGSGAQPQILLGRDPPPGKPLGKPPTMTSAVTLCPAVGVSAPEAWRERIVWRGTLRVTLDAAQWPDLGIIRVLDAAPCTLPGGGLRIDEDPLVPLGLQLLAIMAFLLCTLGRPTEHRTTT